jgi:hypothetical protein
MLVVIQELLPTLSPFVSKTLLLQHQEIMDTLQLLF